MIRICITLLFLAIFSVSTAAAEPPGKHWLNVGDTVNVDIIMASSPGSSMWRTGRILEVHKDMNSYLVKVDDGSKRTIINSDDWIKPAKGVPPAAAAQPQAETLNAPQQSTFNRVDNSSAFTQFQVGQTVNVDRLMASTPGAAQWTTAKIVAVNEKMNSIDVITPDGIRRSIVNSPNWIKPGGGPLPGPAAPHENLPPAANTAKAPPQTEWDRDAGHGKPPDGRYTCHKLSGYVSGGGHDIDLGTLDIMGGNYRGMDPGGAVAPYTVNGEQLIWTRGLDGLPNGWQIKSSKYIGADERGRPLIRIFYQAATRGALECIDCYKER